MSENESKAVATQLEQIAQDARQRSGEPRPFEPIEVSAQPPHPPADPTAGARPRLSHPSGSEVNELWRIRRDETGGLKGRLFALVSRLFGAEIAAQERFNGAQVRFDNALVEWIDERFDATHRHYDAVLGRVGRHLGEVDTRHLMLQEELVKHTHDLVRRIDLVLSAAEASRMGIAQALADVRERLDAIEGRRRTK